MADSKEIPRWMSELSEEDWLFIRRFILASGSLKELAQQYGISYPTLRIRMDRLIEKVRILEDPIAKTSFHRKVKLLVSEGKLDPGVARSLIKAFEQVERGED